MEALAGDSDAAAAAEAAFRQWEATVDETWEARLTEGDAAEALVGTKEVEAEVEAWIKDQVTVERGLKYGCKLSQKKFIAPEFVKHVRNKHAHRVDEARADATAGTAHPPRLGADEVPELQRPAAPADGPAEGRRRWAARGWRRWAAGAFQTRWRTDGWHATTRHGYAPFGGRGGGRRARDGKRNAFRWSGAYAAADAAAAE